MTGPDDPDDRIEAAEPGEPLDDDERWLRAREAGSALPVLSAERAASYERLVEQLRERGPLGAPASARAELDRALNAAAASRRRRRIGLRIAVPAVAAAAVLATWFGTRPGRTDIFAVVVQTAGGSRASLDASSAVGDRLVVDASHAELREVRVYRDDRVLIARCPGDAGCAGGGTRWTLTVRIDAAGIYRAIRIVGATAAPAGSFDADLAALRSVGAVPRVGGVIEVR